MTLVVKYSHNFMRVSGIDFGMIFNLIYSLVFLVFGLYQWSSQRVEFTWKYLFLGTVVGACTVLASTAVMAALSIDKVPAGPVLAVMNGQIIINLIADCII